MPANSKTTSRSGRILVDGELRALLGSVLSVPPSAPPIAAQQLQPASLDLRLGDRAFRIRAGFLPERSSIEARLAEVSATQFSLEGEGAVLEKGLVYLVPLEELLELPATLSAHFNPRSTTGRCDLFTRVLLPGHPRFDEAPAAWRGRPWLEIAPLSFPVRLRRGDRLCQLRLQQGPAALEREELLELYRQTPLCFEGQRPLELDEIRIDATGALELRVGLAGRNPCGWRAAQSTGVLDFSAERGHDTLDFWEPLQARHGHCILDPGRFYIFASKERIRIPPLCAAQMQPVDVGIGELRNNYAGFFDNGFGWQEDAAGKPLPQGSPAVLEVRAHDVPFLVEDGQIFCSLRFFRTQQRPQQLYAQGRAAGSYRGQELTLARLFR